MTEKNNIQRRTFMGTLAALSAGKATGTVSANTGQQEDGSESSAGTDSSHLPNYANRAGRINNEGLDQALKDWNNGKITGKELDQVKEAFRTGRRVVNKTVKKITSNFDSDTVLKKDPNNIGEAIVYQFDGNIQVNAKLEIEPGVIMEFTQGSTLTISTGPIRALGTSSDPIFVTATNARQGWWSGFYFQSNNLKNKLEHMTIEYGGRGANRGCVDVASGAGDSDSVEIVNCTLRWSDEYGLYLTSSATLLSGSGNNSYTDNRESGVRATTSTAHQLSSSSSFTGNDQDFVFVVGDRSSGEGPDQDTVTWNKLDVPYRMHNNHRFQSIEVVIKPDTTLEFTQKSQATFESSARLSIAGGDNKQIVFTGTEKKPGWWNGIYLKTTDTENKLNYCTLEYGGNGSWAGNMEVATGAGDSGQIELQNSKFQNAAGYGIKIGNGGSLSNLSNNTYTKNVDGAAWIGTENVESMASNSTFTGNKNNNDYVRVAARGVSGNGADSDTRTWSALDVPYRMRGRQNISSLKLVINPGATFEFVEDAQLTFDSGARVKIDGLVTETENVKKITFRGTTQKRGWWRGIYMKTSDQKNMMRHVVVEHGGSSGWEGNIEMATGAGDNAYLSYSNCTFRNCESYGIKVGNGGTIASLDQNTYTKNKKGAAWIGTENMEALADTSSFTGNDTDHVRVSSRGINGSGAGSDVRTWDAIDAPYRLNGTHSIDNVELKINKGATLEFTESASITFEGGSRFVIEGTSSAKITFTGSQNQKGWWDGVYLKTTSRVNSMKHVVMEYGGKNFTGVLELGTGAGESGLIETIKNCTFRNNTGYGLKLGSATVNNTGNNTYTGNTDGAAYINTDHMHMVSGTSDFTGNGNDYVRVGATTVSSSDVPTGQSKVTWDNINVPYEMDGATHQSNVEVTLEAGATLQFREKGQLTFSGTGAVLDFVGTSSNKITLTGTRQIQGWWNGIYFNDADSKANTIEYANIDYAGRGLKGALDVGSGAGDNGYINLKNSTITNSGSAGIYVPSGNGANSNVCSVNTFKNNAGTGCVVK